MNFPSENSTIISAYARSAQTYEALPVSLIRRAGLIQKLRSFSCNAIFQFFNVTGSVHLTGSITILLRRSAYPYVHQLCSIFVIIVAAIKYTLLQIQNAGSQNDLYPDARSRAPARLPGSCFLHADCAFLTKSKTADTPKQGISAVLR